MALPTFQIVENTILFLEEIAENPGKLMRYLDQWILSSSLKNVNAIIIGSLEACPTKEIDYKKIIERIREKTGLPVFSTNKFGHAIPNYP